MLNLTSLNQRINYLLTEINKKIENPLTSDLDANGFDILNVNNIDLNTINGGAYPPVVPTDDLDATLTAGNNAGANDIDMNNNDILNVNNIDLTTINSNPYPPAVDNLDATLTAGNSAGANEIDMNNNDIRKVNHLRFFGSSLISDTGSNMTIQSVGDLIINQPSGNMGIDISNPANRLEVLSQNRSFAVLDSGVPNYAEIGWVGSGGTAPTFGYISGYATVLRTGNNRAGLTDRLTINNLGGFRIDGSYGFSGQVLSSNGSGSSPSWTYMNEITVVKTASAVTIPNNSNTTITFNQEVRDTKNWFTSPSATITPNISGTYLITANAIALNSTNRGLINITRNGSVIASTDIGGDANDLSCSIHENITSGQNIAVIIYQNSGVSKTTRVTLGVQLISPI